MPTFRPHLATLAVLATLAALVGAGCGGGGGGSSGGGGGGTGSVTTYGSTTLPGRLIVNSGVGGATAFDLRTGQRASLPASSTDPEHDSWSVGANTTTLLRLNQNLGPTQIEIAFINATGFAAARAPIRMSDRVSTPHLSGDGRLVLTFWSNKSANESNNYLTVFDAATGAVVERGSLLNGFSVTGDPAAWLPDGRYVYFVEKSLYVTKPGSPDADLIADLTSLPGSASTGIASGRMAASPDGKRLAFNWVEARKGGISNDSNLWVVNLDGTGLRRLTSAPDPTSPLDYSHGSPTWSPDGKWVAGVLYMSGVSTAPVFPEAPFGGDRVTGTTGCADQVFVVNVDRPEVALSWPSFDSAHGVKVAAATGAGGQWLGTCGGTISWVP